MVTQDELRDVLNRRTKAVEDELKLQNKHMALLQNIAVYLREDLTKLQNTVYTVISVHAIVAGVVLLRLIGVI